jgi:asparagine synthase (glutamine-hydrolysing)
MGFSVPLAQWFRTTLRPMFEELVLDAEMDAYIDRSEARRLLQEHQTCLANHDRKLWNLLLLAAWRKRHYSAGRVGLLAEARR